MNDDLYKSLFEIVSFFNRPRQDKVLLQRAGVSLDTALFPLVIRLNVHGALGIVELAEQVDRDYSTVSRQVDKLVKLGLVVAANKTTDKRVRQVTLSRTGKTIVKKIAAAREKIMYEALHDWDETQLAELHRTLAHLAETVRRYAKS